MNKYQNDKERLVPAKEKNGQPSVHLDYQTYPFFLTLKQLN